MRLAVISYFAVRNSSFTQYLEDFKGSTSFLIAQHLYSIGYEITFFFRGNQDKNIIIQGINIIFVNDKKPQRSIWYIPVKLHESIVQFDPEIIHFEGMIFPLQVHNLLSNGSKKCRYFIQNHGEMPKLGILLLLQYLFLPTTPHYLFTAKGQEEVWINWGLLRSKQQISYVMEGSNSFEYERRTVSRKKTGINGQPVFIWIGNLNKNKDPVTVLKGFKLILKNHSKARLYMIFKETHLLADLNKLLKEDASLKEAVHLVGTVEHFEVEAYLNSSDYILSGSHREGSGYALSESMACGVVPIVTNIPSFFMMTDEGNIGALWKKSSPESLAESAETVLIRSLKDESQKVLEFFNQHLTSQMIAKKLDGIYREYIN